MMDELRRLLGRVEQTLSPVEVFFETTDWSHVGEIAMGLSLLAGAFFTLVGSIGLLKLDGPMKRLHAPTKAGTLGVGSLLLASMIGSFLADRGSLQELLIMAFIFVTAPISAMFVSKVNMHLADCDPLPKPPRDTMWAVQDVPEADRDYDEANPI